MSGEQKNKSVSMMGLMDVQRTLIVYTNEINSFNTYIRAGFSVGLDKKQKIKTSEQCNNGNRDVFALHDKQKLIHTFQPNKSTDRKHSARAEEKKLCKSEEDGRRREGNPV